MIRKVVRSQEYGVTLKLYRTQFLVDLDSEKVGRVLKLDSIKQGRLWRGMDVLVFNSWHWWTHTGHIQPYTFFCFVFVFYEDFFTHLMMTSTCVFVWTRWDYMEDGKRLYKDMNRLVAYYKGMTTWSRWVNAFVDPSKTKVFFNGVSPTHYE